LWLGLCIRFRTVLQVLMVFAFGWLGPWGALAYTTYEKILGLSHKSAKRIHFLLQTGAFLTALIGVTSKVQGINAVSAAPRLQCRTSDLGATPLFYRVATPLAKQPRFSCSSHASVPAATRHATRGTRHDTRGITSRHTWHTSRHTWHMWPLLRSSELPWSCRRPSPHFHGLF
jgi:hypothetical protein